MKIFETKRGFFLSIGAFFALIGVIVGAAASHALKAHLTLEQLEWVDIGHRYLVWHTLALILVDCLPVHGGRGAWRGLAGYCFLGGILLFTGSLWLMGLLGFTGLGILTPVGGFAFIAGWTFLFVHALSWLRQQRPSPQS